jgi:SnoaL-like domain
VPWVAELFSAREIQRWRDERRRAALVAVPYYTGLLAGEPGALVESFAGEPEVHHPVRGRIRGSRAFADFAAETAAGLKQRNVSVEDVEHVVSERRGFEEVVLHVDGLAGRVALPVAVVADREPDGRIRELRIYSSTWPFTAGHAGRPPILQADPELRESGVVATYQRALAAGDAGAIVAAFEADGYAREPAGAGYVHRGADGLRAFYELLFSNGGGIALERCTLLDDGRVCALEYNVVRWGRSELLPAAGFAAYVRGRSGKLAAARIYDDVDPPLGSHDRHAAAAEPDARAGADALRSAP